MIDTNDQPGKLLVITKKKVNKINIIRKFTNELITTIIGKHAIGNFIFFIKLAFSKKTFCDRIIISEKNPQVIIPEQR